MQNTLVEFCVDILHNSKAAAYRDAQRPNSGLVLRQYQLPLFSTQLGDLAICPLEFQRTVLRIRYHLELFNQSIPYVQSLAEKTFSDLSENNRRSVISNVESGYREIGERAEIIAKAIAVLQAQKL